MHDVDSSATAQDLERIVSDSRDNGDLPAELSLMLDRILEFPEQDVEHAMIPRSLVATVRPDTTIGEVRELMARAHTRYPVVDDESQPLGVVQLADVLGSMLSEDAPVTELMQPAVVLSTLMKLPDALAEITRAHNELACVIDEYGGFAGVLTLEDLAEEIVGEMHRAIGYELPTGDFETVAGLIIAERGGLPVAGDTIHVPLPDDPADLVRYDVMHRSLEIQVLRIERRVPSEVRVTLIETLGNNEELEKQSEPVADDTTEVDR